MNSHHRLDPKSLTIQIHEHRVPLVPVPPRCDSRHCATCNDLDSSSTEEVFVREEGDIEQGSVVFPHLSNTNIQKRRSQPTDSISNTSHRS